MIDAQLNMNLFDTIVFLTLVIAAGISLYRGFIQEFLSLATWLGAGLITLALSEGSTAFMLNYMTSAFGAALVGILGTYFFVVIILGFFAKFVLRYIREGSEVGWPDHVLGLVFGFFKGGLVVVIGFILMTLLFREDGYPEWIRTASTLPTVQKAAVAIVRMMPEHLGTISTLGEPTDDDIALQQQQQISPVQTQAFGQEIQREVQPVRPTQQTPEQANALEQLIMDITNERQE